MLALLETAAQTVGSATESDGHGSFPITVLVFFSVLFIYVIAGSAFEHFEVHSPFHLEIWLIHMLLAALSPRIWTGNHVRRHRWIQLLRLCQQI